MKKLLTYYFTLVCLLGVNSVLAEVISIDSEPYEKASIRVGKLDFYRTYMYSFKSSGLINELNVDVGDEFSNGATLASVDVDDLNARLNDYLAQKSYVNNEVKRLGKLQKQDAVSKSELERYKSQSSQLKANIIGIRKTISASVIKAPFDGVVVGRNVELGEWASPGQPVLEVAPIDENIVITVGVSKSELTSLSIGKTVPVTDEFGQQYQAQVFVINKTPELSTGLYLVHLSIESNQSVPIGTLFKVPFSAATDFVFKVPIHYLDIDFDGTAIVTVVNGSSISNQRFSMVGVDSNFAYVKAGNLQNLKITNN